MHVNVFDVTKIKIEDTTDLRRGDDDTTYVRRIHIKSDRGPLTLTLFNRDYKEDLNIKFPIGDDNE